MKYLFIFNLLYSTSAFAIIQKCGEYKFSGKMIKDQNKVTLLINEKTQSEYKVTFDDNSSFKARIYLNDHVDGKIKITTLEGVTSFKDSTLLEISQRIPNPLNPRDTYLSLNKEQKCSPATK